ncbi:hypothetical protein OG389_00020 [Streptomyces sp. NBC_00435]|uniref:terpene synthase family protein n=1 Tax=Streptomyces sp. NBC_00435 TaxID=2903649 RepID=UPI002E23319F
MKIFDESAASSPALLTFYCPFDSEVNPEKDLLVARCAVWAKRFGLGGGGDAAEVYAITGASLVAWFFPRARGALAQVLADYSAWAFGVNDRVTPPPSPGSTLDVINDIGRWTRIMRAADTFVDDGSLIEAAARDVFRRLKVVMTPAQLHRFTTYQVVWMWDMTWVTALRERGEELGVNTYLAMRLSSVGTYATLGYLDAVGGIEPPEAELRAPKVLAACEAGFSPPAWTTTGTPC